MGKYYEKDRYRRCRLGHGLHVGFGRRSGGTAYTKAPVAPVAVYNWGGFYIGGHVGGAWTNQEWVNTANVIPGDTFGDLAPGQGFRQSGSGIFGGGHAGYNWQASNFASGLEGTI